MSYDGTQLSLHNIDVKSDASLDDFSAPIFTPLLRAISELNHAKLKELFIFGDKHSGKTHLLYALRRHYSQLGKSVMYLPLEECLDDDPAILTGLETFSLLLIDDVHLIATHRAWQEALFHLINRARQSQCQLIYTSEHPVTELTFELSDLLTRLSQSLTRKLANADSDSDRQMIIDTILRKKYWRFDQAVIDALIAEGPRHTGELVTVIERIAPLFSPPYMKRPRHKLSPKHLANIKDAIREQSFLLELADISLDGHDDLYALGDDEHNHGQLHENNLKLPL